MKTNHLAAPLSELLLAAEALRGYIDALDSNGTMPSPSRKTSGALLRLIEGWCVDHADELAPALFANGATITSLSDKEILAVMRHELSLAPREVAIVGVEPEAKTPSCEILHVGDDVAEGGQLREFSALLGWRIIQTEKGGVAGQMAHERPFDVIIVSQTTEDMSGPSAIEGIRALGGHNDETPIIFLADDMSNEERVQLDRLGVVRVEPKPLLLSTFRLMVANLKAFGRAAE